ncbi:hypothetical protein [Methylobacter sp.]|uniref:hypothetical protein n=1 Tax=Methylobacter sp. TaxID=2051955 RepID=UPI002FDCE9E8
MIEIYDWSIRKVVFKHCNFYESYLVGYAPDCRRLDIACIKRFYLKEQLICCKNRDKLYLLYGSSGLTDEAEEIWSGFKKVSRIIYEIDITDKYDKSENELNHQ